MFKASSKSPTADWLTVQVHAIGSQHAFGLAHQILVANARTLRLDPASGKEFLHFAYAQPHCTVWLQRDHGRSDVYELIVRWEDQGVHEVYVITNTVQPIGNDQRLQQLLHSVLTVPSIVPTAGQHNKL